MIQLQTFENFKHDLLVVARKNKTAKFILQEDCKMYRLLSCYGYGGSKLDLFNVIDKLTEYFRRYFDDN